MRGALDCFSKSIRSGGAFIALLSLSSCAYRLKVPHLAASLTDVWPPTGFTTGGEILTLVGSGFDSSMTVSIGGSPCTGVSLLSSGYATCTLPPGAAGSVDVTVEGSANSTTLPGGFTYRDETLSLWESVSPYADTYQVGSWEKLPIPAIPPPLAGTVGNGIVYSPDGGLLAIGAHASPYLALYDALSGSALPGPSPAPPGDVFGVAFSPDGSLLALAMGASPFVSVEQTSDWTLPSSQPGALNGSAYGVAFSPDQSLLAVAYNTTPYIKVFETGGWTLLGSPAVLPTAVCYGVAFSPDGTLLAVVSNASPYLIIYNTSDWSQVSGPSSLPTASAQGVAFSPDGQWLAVGFNTSPYLAVYRTSDWSLLPNPSTLPTGGGYGVAFNADSSKLAISYISSPYLTVYSTQDWSAFAEPASLPEGSGVAVAFSPPGLLPPTIAAISPSSGSSAGGTSLSIRGTGFGAGTTVLIGGTECSNVQVSSFSSLSCVAPGGMAGAQTVSVITPLRGSGILAGGFTYH